MQYYSIHPIKRSLCLLFPFFLRKELLALHRGGHNVRHQRLFLGQISRKVHLLPMKRVKFRRSVKVYHRNRFFILTLGKQKWLPTVSPSNEHSFEKKKERKEKEKKKKKKTKKKKKKIGIFYRLQMTHKFKFKIRGFLIACFCWILQITGQEKNSNFENVNFFIESLRPVIVPNEKLDNMKSSLDHINS